MFHVKHCVELLRIDQIFAEAGSFSYECVCSFDHFIARMHVIPEHQECLECLNPWMPESLNCLNFWNVQIVECPDPLDARILHDRFVECLERLNPWMPGQSSSFFKICSLWFTNIDVTW